MKWGTLYGVLGGAAIGGGIAYKETGEGYTMFIPILAGLGGGLGLLFGGLSGYGETIYILKEAALARAAKD